MLLIILPACT